MFHLEKHRHQLIIEIDLPAEAKKKYKQAKEADPKATFTLKTTQELALSTSVAEKQAFQATIETKFPEK